MSERPLKARNRKGSFGSVLLSTVVLAAASLAAAGCGRTATAPVSAPLVTNLGPSLDERLTRGRVVYQAGESQSGRKITAVIGGGAEVPATLLACAGCHGRDGRGRIEGAIAPSDLTRTTLTKPYDHVRPDGRRRPPYTKALLTRAIAMGFDSGGATLDPAMPRYRLSIEDNTDLLAYLERLGDDDESGVSDDSVRIGVLLPSDAAGPVHDVLTSYLDELNRQGGIYHRRLSLRSVEMSRDAARLSKAVQAVATGDDAVFALVAANLTGGEPLVTACAAGAGVPLVGVTAPPDAEQFGFGRPAFFLLAGPVDQSFALARFLRTDARTNATMAIVHGADESQRTLARAVTDRYRRDGMGSAINLEIQDASHERNSAAEVLRKASAIILLGPPGGMATLLRSVVSGAEGPHVIIPAHLRIATSSTSHGRSTAHFI